MKIKSIPNMLTAFRIACSSALLGVEPLTAGFFGLYLLCGISDMLDGYLARRIKATSRIGALLDSVADFIFISLMAIILLPIVKLPAGLAAWLIGIAAIKLLTLLAGFLKYGTIAFLHTWSNKITGFAVFLFPLLCGIEGSNIPIAAGIVCVMASMAATEELLITLTAKKLNPDIRSIFFK